MFSLKSSIHSSLLLLSISLFVIVSCQEEESLANDSPYSRVTLKAKGGNGNGNGGGKGGGKEECPVIQFTYWTEGSGTVFSAGESITQGCIDAFRGDPRVLGIQLATNWACLIDGTNDTNGPGNVSCYGYTELYYKPGKSKYRVVLTGGSWDNGCIPEVGAVSCFDFHLMEIGPDGHHKKACITTDGPIDIGLHTICIRNDGEVL